MKKLIPSLLLWSIFCWLGASSRVEAFPFIEVEGFVSPGAATDNGNGTVTFISIDYYFNVTTATSGAEMNFLSLEFEGDVFASPGTISGINPADWSTSTVSSSGGSIYQIASAGTTLGIGESLSFTMLNAVLFSAALIDSSLWQEGQIWSQSWLARDSFGGGDGGSTALLEPTTLVLLGSGLVLLGFLGRKRKLGHND